MATKKQIAQVMESAINEAVNFLNMNPPTIEDMYKNPPTIEDMYEHALGVKLGEDIKAQIHKRSLEAQAKEDALFRQLENIEPLPIRIAKEIQAMQSASGVSDKTPETRKRYPKDREALEVLQEARRRKNTKSYSGDSNAAIIKHMINEWQSKWLARILHGKLKGKANGQGREHKKPLDVNKAAETWGKYLSAYLRDRLPKQGA